VIAVEVESEKTNINWLCCARCGRCRSGVISVEGQKQWPMCLGDMSACEILLHRYVCF